MLARSSIAGAEVDDGHDDRGEEHPGELIPVEEGEAEEGGGEAGVDPREEQAGVGQQEEEQPGVGLRRLPGVVLPGMRMGQDR